MKRALLVTAAFPPTALPEAMLVAKRLGALQGRWSVDVVTLAPFRPWMGDDARAATYAERRFVRVERVDAGWARRAPIFRLGILSAIPDPLRWMNGRLVRRATSLGLHSYDALLSWSQWHSAHLAALRLKSRRPDLPWLAHFSDPWVGNPYKDMGRFTRRINEHLQRRVLGAADALTFTAPESRDVVLEGAPDAWRRKAHIFPHAFDAELYPKKLARRPDGPFVVRHLGHFYGPRSPRPLLEAISTLARREPSLLDKVSFELIGTIEPTMRTLDCWQQVPDGMVRICEPVSYLDSLALMGSADLLAAVDAPAERSAFLPSKLVDYLGADVPILALTPPGPSERLVRSLGGWSAHPSDAEGAVAALRDAIVFMREHPGATFVDPAISRGFSAEAQGRGTADLLDELASSSTMGQAR